MGIESAIDATVWRAVNARARSKQSLQSALTLHGRISKRVALNGERAVFYRPHRQTSGEKIMTYKGYQAIVELQEEAGVFMGK